MLPHLHLFSAVGLIIPLFSAIPLAATFRLTEQKTTPLQIVLRMEHKSRKRRRTFGLEKGTEEPIWLKEQSSRFGEGEVEGEGERA
jgi:hypothetical protein